MVRDSGITLDAIDITATGQLTTLEDGRLGFKVKEAELVYLLEENEKANVLKKEKANWQRDLTVVGRIVEQQPPKSEEKGEKTAQEERVPPTLALQSIIFGE